MKKALFLTILFAIYYLLFAVRTYAAVSCQPIYGGGQACVTAGNILINKTVLNPQTNKMVDNLGINDPKYQPGFIVNFQVTLTNTGSTNISHIDVKDIFPQFVNFNAGPGNFDANTKTLSFGVDNLNANETRTFTITGNVVNADQLPIDQGIVCVVNQATATADGSTSQDNSQLCIEKKFTPTQAPQVQAFVQPGVPTTKGGLKVFPAPSITTTPPTGPESLALFSLVPTGIVGWLLRKYSYKKTMMKGGEK